MACAAAQAAGQATDHTGQPTQTATATAAAGIADRAQQRGDRALYRAGQVLHRALHIALCQCTGGVLQPAGQRTHRDGHAGSQPGRTGHAAHDMAQRAACTIEHRRDAIDHAIHRRADRRDQAMACAAAQAAGQATDYTGQSTQARALACTTAGQAPRQTTDHAGQPARTGGAATRRAIPQAADHMRHATDHPVGDMAGRAGEPGDAGCRPGDAAQRAASTVQGRGDGAVNHRQCMVDGAGHMALRQRATRVLKAAGECADGVIHARTQRTGARHSGQHACRRMAGAVRHRRRAVDHAVHQRTDAGPLQQAAGQFLDRADRGAGHRAYRVATFLLARQQHVAQPQQSAMARCPGRRRRHLQQGRSAHTGLDRAGRRRHRGQRRGRRRYRWGGMAMRGACADRQSRANAGRCNLQPCLHRHLHDHRCRQLHRYRRVDARLHAADRQGAGDDAVRVGLAVLGDQRLQVIQPRVGGVCRTGEPQGQQATGAHHGHRPGGQQAVRAAALAMRCGQLRADHVGVEGAVPDQSIDAIHGRGLW